ncbi:hypothetical protein Z043_115234, partial [Scleropages formosus]
MSVREQSVAVTLLVHFYTFAIQDMALQEGPKKLLDMSPSAVDDQFLSCRDRMLQSLMGRGGLLERELSNSDGFRRAWQNKTCGGPIQRGKLEHTKALETYVTDSKFRVEPQTQLLRQPAVPEGEKKSRPDKPRPLSKEALQEGPKKLLDMSPSAVDDQFLSCRDRMLQSLMGSGGLLERELNNSDGFHAAWQNETCGGPIQ